MSLFLEKKVIPSSKCRKCLINQKKLCSVKLDNISVEKKGNGKLLFILEMPERPRVYDKFKNWLNKNLINDYEIVVGLQCQTKDFTIPSPMYKTFAQCNLISEKLSNAEVIVPIGRAIFSITQNDDIISWTEFREYLFNQTYLYTPYKWNKRVRVYPIPALIDWVDKNNFQRFFVAKQLNNIKEYLASPTIIETPANIIKVDDPNDFLRQYEHQELELGWDTETSGLDHFDPNFKVRCITMSFNGEDGYYLPYEKINKRLLTSFFKNKYQILVNGKYDYIALTRDGIGNCRVDEDIAILYHLLNTDRLLNGLKSLSWLIGYGGYEDKLSSYIKENKIKNYFDIPEKLMVPYSTLDAIVPYRLFDYARKNLIPLQQQVYDTYKKSIIPSIENFAKMQITGIDINNEKFNILNKELVEEILELEKILYNLLETKVDLNSPDKVAKLFEFKGFPCYGRTDKKTHEVNGEQVGLYKVGDYQLQKWSREEYKVASYLIKYRALSKLQSSFVGSEKEEKSFLTRKNLSTKNSIEGLTKFIKSDNKIHASIDPARTSTGRSISSNPNLQQMPKQGKEGKRFRPIFKAPENYLFGEADYRGFQLRIAAILSKDSMMEDIFLNKSGDMHSVTAHNVFYSDVSLDEFLINVEKEIEPYKTYRQDAKGVNFGFVFGRSAFGFKPDIEENWSSDQIDNYVKNNNLEIILDKNGGEDLLITVAEDIRNKYFDTYKGLLPWIKSQHNFAKKNGYAEGWHGIRRHLPYMKHIGTDTLQKDISGWENIAVNSPVQAFEAIEAYNAINSINREILKRNLKSVCVGMMHDSIVLYIHKNEIEEMYYIIKNAMENKETWKIPILIDIQIGDVWGFSPNLKEENLKEFAEKYKIK